MPRLAAIAVALLGGCNQILGLDDVRIVDGGVDGDPLDCPPPPPGTVIGCATITHVRADGTTFRSRKDLRRFAVAAYLADDGPAGFRVVSGTASADGVIRIEDVPDGAPYYLRLHDPQDPHYAFPHFFYTDQHWLELGYVQLGRDDTPATLETPITFDLSGLTPWKPGDYLSIESFNAGTSHELGLQRPPPDNAIALRDTVDWRAGHGEFSFGDIRDLAGRVAQLIDGRPGQGDDLWLLHMTTTTLTSGSMRPYFGVYIVDRLQSTSVVMADGMPHTVAGALQPVAPAPAPQRYRINLAALRTAFRDGNRYATEDLRCFRSANAGADHGLFQGAVVGLAGQIWGGETSLIVETPYGNPFPASWPHMMSCSLQHLRYVMIPGTTRMLYGYAYLTSHTPATDEYTWMPAIRPPTNIRVGGVDGLAGGAVAFDGIAPVTISWDVVPGVNRYQVRVQGATEGFLAVFDTQQTFVAMPADTFTKGNFYVFRVVAVQTAGDYVGGRLYELTMPMWIGRVSTGLFRFSDECGDGALDGGEECDTGGSTSACDADCSVAMCGDGFVNPSREACDEVVDAPHCDVDCTVPQCADGHWNRTIEECDDGNIAGGDGCSPMCKLERCGDGTIDPPFEECDDRNRINGDGCTAFCQPF